MVAAAVHPAFVTANRNNFVQLVMSNLFGQTRRIAAAESQYEHVSPKRFRDDRLPRWRLGGGGAIAALRQAALQGLSAPLSGAIAGNPAAAEPGAVSFRSPGSVRGAGRQGRSLPRLAEGRWMHIGDPACDR